MDQMLIIDLHNVSFRAAYAHMANMKHGKNNSHPLICLLKQMTGWMNKMKPTSICIALDCPRQEVWRRKVLPTYKDRDNNNEYMKDLSKVSGELNVVAKEFFKYMNIRQFYRKEMEADDMIYAIVSEVHPHNTMVITSDSDMVQVPYSYHSSTVYDPVKNEVMVMPEVSPTRLKVLVGDKTDKIKGYDGIGPKKGAILAKDYKALEEFLDKNGRAIYNRNLILVDLSFNPRLAANRLYVQKKLAEDLVYDPSMIMDLISKYKIHGLISEFQNLIAPFAGLNKNGIASTCGDVQNGDDQ